MGVRSEGVVATAHGKALSPEMVGIVYQRSAALGQESPETASGVPLGLDIIEALADGGLRCSEAAALIWGDVEL